MTVGFTEYFDFKITFSRKNKKERINRSATYRRVLSTAKGVSNNSSPLIIVSQTSVNNNGTRGRTKGTAGFDDLLIEPVARTLIENRKGIYLDRSLGTSQKASSQRNKIG